MSTCEARGVRVVEAVTAESRPTYVVIACHGRCGSNWLLEIFDKSPFTHCRNEANAYSNSPFASLPSSGIHDAGSESRLDERWDDALRWAHEHMGRRDGLMTAPKSYFHETSRKLGLVSLMQRARARRMLASFLPSLRGEEWLLPRWLGDREKLRATLPVIKLGFPAGWMPWVMRSRPDVHVLHLTRHPGGYLSSWMARFLATHDREATTHANRLRLYEIARADPSWGPRFGEIATMSVEEAEVWYFLYAAETTHAGSSTCERYDVLHYEDLVHDVVGAVRPIFERTGLEWNAAIEARVRSTATMPSSQASKWREKIDSKHLAMVERLIQSSPLAGWW